VLIIMVIGILAFADVYTLGDKERCTANFGKSKWPMYIGCAMTAHEGLAGGLLAGAGALFAAWLAFDAVQEQLVEERERRRQLQADAKETAVICITQPIHAAAATLSAIDGALAAPGGLIAPKNADEAVARGARQLAATLDSFVVREAYQGLSSDDRILYLAIIGTLTSFVSIAADKDMPFFDRKARLENQRTALMRIHIFLADFDEELGKIYARDSKTMAPTFQS
jgi:hypothetical protein